MEPNELFLIWVIQLAPLAAFFAILLSPKPFKRFAPAVAILGALSAAISFLALLFPHWAGNWPAHETSFQWLYVAAADFFPKAGGIFALRAGFLMDRLNMLMIGIVTTITFFVQVFSYYYMKDDPSRPRYFMFLSFFAFTMTGLVLSSNLLQTFFFWELVGLASYLLIGFWYQKPSASTAARKAFVINRLGDLGFYLGIILIFLYTGNLDFVSFSAESLRAAMGPQLAMAAGLLVLMGVMGKSAQFPMHVWLPDAMEGPTPVSALIHSATMVAAGVFLLVRAFGLFSASSVTLDWILALGAITAILAALLATAQSDIKKILAYSTVSQLGFMAMALGAHSPVAAMFHLTTHAYFKSLLFLTSGAFIHHFHTNDIWEMARHGARKRIFDCIALSVGLFSLTGMFPFAGFFSKDLILDVLREHGLFYYGVALAGSFLTTYYSFRLIFIFMLTKTQNGNSHHPHETAHHVVDEWSPAEFAKIFSLGVLMVLALGAGVLGSHFFHHKTLIWLGGEAPHTNLEILVTALLVFAAAMTTAFLRFRHPEQAQIRWEKNVSFIKRVLDNKFYIDDLYAFAVKRVGLAFAALLNRFDRGFVNDVMVNGTSYRILDLGKIASKLQSGIVQNYLFIILAAGAGAAWWLLGPGKGF